MCGLYLDVSRGKCDYWTRNCRQQNHSLRYLSLVYNIDITFFPFVIGSPHTPAHKLTKSVPLLFPPPQPARSALAFAHSINEMEKSTWKRWTKRKRIAEHPRISRFSRCVKDNRIIFGTGISLKSYNKNKINLYRRIHLRTRPATCPTKGAMYWYMARECVNVHKSPIFCFTRSSVAEQGPPSIRQMKEHKSDKQWAAQNRYSHTHTLANKVKKWNWNTK